MTSSKHSDSGAHRSRRPRPRRAPTLFGPRARISAEPRTDSRSASSPHRSAASNHARIPTPVVARNTSTGRGQHVLGGGEQGVLVHPMRIERQRRTPLDLGAAAFEQHDLLLGLARRRDPDPEPGEGHG